MVPLPPQLGLHSPTDMFRHPGHCCRALLLGGTGGGIHSHDGQGKQEGSLGGIRRVFNICFVQVIRWMVITVILTYIGLFIFEDIPTIMVVCGLVAQVRLVSQVLNYVTLMNALGGSFGSSVQFPLFLDQQSFLHLVCGDGNRQSLSRLLLLRREVLPFQ